MSRIAPIKGTDLEPNPWDEALMLAETVEEVKRLKLGGPGIVVKHMGPGPHPGTGTEQAVHGRGGGVSVPRRRPGGFDDRNILEWIKGIGESGSTTEVGGITFTRIRDAMDGSTGLDGSLLMAEQGDIRRVYTVTRRIVNEKESWALESPNGSIFVYEAHQSSLQELNAKLRRAGFDTITPNIPKAPDEDFMLNVQFDPPEEFPEFVDDSSLLTLDNYETTQGVLFGGPTNEFNSALQARTVAGRQAVGSVMEYRDGDEIAKVFADEFESYRTAQVEWLDQKWEEAYGLVSENGVGEDGELTWLRYNEPTQIEGQLGLRTIVENPDLHPEFNAFDDDEFSTYEWGGGHDLSNPFDLNNFTQNVLPRTEFVEDWFEARHPGRTGYRGAVWEEWVSDKENMEWYHFDHIGQESTIDQLPIVRDMLWTMDNSDNDPAELVHWMREQWAGSSSHPVSIAVQRAVENNFDISADTGHFFGNAAVDGGLLYDSFGLVFDSYVKAVYDVNQHTLGQLGVTHIPLVRGMALSSEDFSMDDDLFSGVKPGRWTKATIDLQPLSSFSTSPEISSGFTRNGQGGKTGTFIRTVVPIERVWGTSLDGFGSLGEREVIVLGDTDFQTDIVFFGDEWQVSNINNFATTSNDDGFGWDT